MREHRFDTEEAALRPKSARVDDSVSDDVGRAAAQGRSDVLGPEGMLGLQRAAGNGGVTAMVEEERSPVHDVVSSSGRPLDPDVRHDMEGRLGHDFADVRVHDDGAAHASAKAVNAHAYTVGSNIVFQRDAYDPSSTAGRTTLAHELTHVVQQRHGPVDGSPAGGGVNVSDPSDRFEREASTSAERAMAGPAPEAHPVAASGATDAAVQREAAPEEEDEQPTVQGAFVQRQEGEEDDEETAG